MDLFKLGAPIKEPDIKKFVELEVEFDIEFREYGIPRDFKYEAKKEPRKFYFALISTDNVAQILYTQKNIIRRFSPEIALKWMTENSSIPTDFRTDLPAHTEREVTKYPTIRQIRNAIIREAVERERWQQEQIQQFQEYWRGKKH